LGISTEKGASSHKILNAIARAFPHRISERELSRQLGLSERWLRTLSRQAFNNTFGQLMRRIWVHQALRMMEHTDLDNTEIALHLNYSEESSMARDFRKELGFGCAEARKRLLNSTPLELIKQAFLLVLKAVPTILLPLWYENFSFGFDEVLNSAVSSFC
jgi:AraC-like DNA-binding protein